MENEYFITGRVWRKIRDGATTDYRKGETVMERLWSLVTNCKPDQPFIASFKKEGSDETISLRSFWTNEGIVIDLQDSFA